MKKLIIFDLDGVLIDSKGMHFDALNKALAGVDEKYVISKEEQATIYEGLPTHSKLNLLSDRKGLSKESHRDIWMDKQRITVDMFSNIPEDTELISFMELIKKNNINIAVASNSILETIEICLTRLGIKDFVEHIVSNEDVKHPKPHPEMYWKAMSYFGCITDDTIIFEDSIVGRIAAIDSKATLIKVKNRRDLDLDKIEKAVTILLSNKGSWKESNLNVLIPMAGAGSRFAEAGYAFPKPLIDVHDKPMIQAVVDNLAIEATYTYIVQKSHFEKYNLSYLLNAITPNCNIVQVDGVTEGVTEDVDTNITVLTARLDEVAYQEIERGVSLIGPHRDDLHLQLGDFPAKGYASHGESWSMAISLRIGSFNLLKSEGASPILILDDVFAELDTSRRIQLMSATKLAEQTFITAAVESDLPAELLTQKFYVTPGVVKKGKS